MEITVIRVFFALLLLIAPAAAQEAVTYAPEICEFSATFPDTPTVTKRCDANLKNCYEQAAYNYYSDTKNRVAVRVICNQISAETKARYTQNVMETTVRAMARSKGVTSFETSTRRDDEYVQTGLAGQDNNLGTPRIFIAQLWIGETSSMSVEAELVGENDISTDEKFSAILKSIGVKPEPTLEKNEDTTASDSLSAQP